MKCLFIYNPNSGKGKVVKKEQYIVEKLKTKYDVVDVAKTEYPHHASVIASENINKYDTFVVAGGDGTLNEIINAIAEKENAPTIGYIPTGTANDVAHSLKIPRSIKGAVKTILGGKVFNHDIFKVNNKYGIYVCATGLGCKISYETKQSKKRFWGKLAYFFSGAKTIFKTKPLKITLKFNETVVEKNCALLLIVNSRYVGGFKINKKACLDDGYVDVVMIESTKKNSYGLFGLINIAKLFLFGLNYTKKKKHISYFKLKDFEISLNSDAEINLDGECGLDGSFKYSALKEGVKIYIP